MGETYIVVYYAGASANVTLPHKGININNNCNIHLVHVGILLYTQLVFDVDIIGDLL